MKPTLTGKAPCNNIEIYFETFGQKHNQAILLIMGLDAQSIMFTNDFIEPLVEAGYYVIRFDNRDIGLSTWLNDTWHRRRPYTLEDMAKDSIGLLDYLSIAQAHVIGVSMGGMIAQRIAISHAERVLCLVSIMSSGFMLNPQAVPFFKGKPFVRLIPFFLRNFTIKSKLAFPAITIESYVATYRRLNGKTFPFNHKHLRTIFTEGIEQRKGQNPRARFQQFCSIAASGSRLHELPKIKAPTLVIHGTEDPLIPPVHAKIYAPKIPKAKMQWVNGMGHQLPKPVLEIVMPEIIGHLKTNSF
ncbi:alpha/beta fold hydrolase [Emticicia sp. BO119]|uniref:alpha/beta fold hydrolase n=1 Tax=Emticicia sp. BO119 TaxID=2757768 RepID=UPI0015F10348|nr:alpha/beta hydrolase [Emticicia sp. BO119]MBA4849782.1 alpha/beta hydrolase [Emticicia sp. BO119]